jgi:hypothetical protein
MEIASEHCIRFKAPESSMEAKCFDYECDLVSTFSEQLKHQGQTSAIGFEFDYSRGRIDVVTLEGNELIAYEAKLFKWKSALAQAYRNTSFCCRSYVVMPEKAAKNLERNFAEFRKRGVGICIVGEEGFRILLEAQLNKPLQPWLMEEAKEFIRSSHGF